MRKWIFLLILSVIVAVVAHLPLAWVAPKNVPVSFLGTVWSGAVTDIPNFPPVKTHVSAVKAITGEPPISFSAQTQGLNVEGTLSLGRTLNLTTHGSLAFIARVDGRLSDLQGRYNMQLADMLIKHSCVSGSGTVKTDILMRNELRWQWRGPELSGPVACEQGDVVLSLSGQDRTQNVSADIRLSLQGTYIITANVETSDQRAGVFLPLYGFQKSGTVYRLNEQGRWM